MPLGERVLHERGEKEGISLKRRYSTIIGSSNVKMVADGQIHLPTKRLP